MPEEHALRPGTHSHPRVTGHPILVVRCGGMVFSSLEDDKMALVSPALQASQDKKTKGATDCSVAPRLVPSPEVLRQVLTAERSTPHRRSSW